MHPLKTKKIETRTLKLTQAEVDIIETALQFAYNKQMQVLEDNRPLMIGKEYQMLLDNADKFYHIKAAISFNKKDV